MIFLALIFIRCIHDNPNLIFEETKKPEIAQKESKAGFLFAKHTVKRIGVMLKTSTVYFQIIVWIDGND